MNFDLNIENYATEELIQMFELPKNFDENIVKINETKIKDKINNNTEINNKTKVETLKFITEAKNLILKFLEKRNPTNTMEKFKNSLSAIYHTDYELKPIELEEDTEHMIQNRKQAPYVSSSPSEYFSGIITLSPLIQ